MKPVQKLKAIPADPLTEKLRGILIGQDEAIKTIVPFVQMYHAGLSPEGRPIGVILLLGPTGTGKTRTVEALAEVLHGSAKTLLRVDCGEFQNEHEVAKLIGAPPGYLGHRETQPMLTQAKVHSMTSDTSDISLLLFDEIEKASGSLHRLLLGIFDKSTLHLGDNSTVNFDKALIFLTSNLGGKSIQRANRPEFGFESMRSHPVAGTSKLHNIGMAAVKRRFTPEFVNRIDAVVTYEALNRETFAVILEQILTSFGALLAKRLGLRSFSFQVTPGAKSKLLDLGTSTEFGARELKRTVQRHLIQPVAARVSRGEIPAGSTVVLDAKDGDFQIFVRQ